MALSRILIIGATGYIGRHIANASISAGHPTYLLLRYAGNSNPEKQELVRQYTAKGATILNGGLEDYETLVEAIKKVDVVISAVGHPALADQMMLISAIQEAGNIKRFLPSEFGIDVDRNLNKPLAEMLQVKRQVRRAVEQSKIPYTFVSCNNTFGFFLTNLTQTGMGYTSPPRDKVIMYGDGTTKAVYVAEEDMGTYIIKAVDDPRTLNKIMYIRPPANIWSQKELFELWERKTGLLLQKTIQSEEELVKEMDELPYPMNLYPAFRQALFVQGVEMLEMGPDVVDAIELYDEEEVPYMKVDNFLDNFI